MGLGKGSAPRLALATATNDRPPPNVSDKEDADFCEFAPFCLQLLFDCLLLLQARGRATACYS